MTEVSIISEQSGFFVFFKSAGLSSSRRPKEVEFFTCKDVTLVDLLLKSFIFSFISRDVWTQGDDSNMPSLLKIMFKITNRNTVPQTSNLLLKNFSSGLDPLHANISMHILLTVLYVSPKVLTKRICLKIKSFLFGDHFLYSRDPNV